MGVGDGVGEVTGEGVGDVVIEPLCLKTNSSPPLPSVTIKLPVI